MDITKLIRKMLITEAISEVTKNSQDHHEAFVKHNILNSFRNFREGKEKELYNELGSHIFKDYNNSDRLDYIRKEGSFDRGGHHLGNTTGTNEPVSIPHHLASMIRDGVGADELQHVYNKHFKFPHEALQSTKEWNLQGKETHVKNHALTLKDQDSRRNFLKTMVWHDENFDPDSHLYSDQGMQNRSHLHERVALLHHGFTDDDLQHLHTNYRPTYYNFENRHFFMNTLLKHGWYTAGKAPETNYLRSVASAAFGGDVADHVREPMMGIKFHASHANPSHVESMKALKKETEEFLKKQHNTNDLDSKHITLYRGVAGKFDKNSYNFGNVESWTSDKSAAINFANITAKHDNKHAVTLISKSFPLSKVLISHETHKNQIPSENSLVVTGEHVVLHHPSESTKFENIEGV